MPIKVAGGKEYKLVSERLVALREKWEDASISTDTQITPNGVILSATITAGARVSTGHAYCNPGLEKALEKAETTAVGRALAFLDPDLMGSEIASAEEMHDFHAGEIKKKIEGRYKAYGLALQKHWDSLSYIREMLDTENLSAAWEAWNEIEEDDRIALRMASTKGGWLSVTQANKLGEASNQDFNPETGVYESIAK